MRAPRRSRHRTGTAPSRDDPPEPDNGSYRVFASPAGDSSPGRVAQRAASETDAFCVDRHSAAFLDERGPSRDETAALHV
jgi:hypothetical protein